MSGSPARDDSLRLYRRMLTYSWPYKWIFLVAVLGMAILAATSAGFSAGMKPLIDDGFVGRDPDAIRRLPLLLIGLYGVRVIAGFLAEYAMTWVAQRVTFDIRNQIFGRLVDLPVSFYERHATGTLISKIIFDVSQISRAVTEAIITIVRDGLQFIALFGWLLYLNWKLTLIFSVLAPVSGLMLRVMSRRFRSLSHEIQTSMGEISQVTQEATEGQRVVKAFNAQAQESRWFEKASDRSRRFAMRKVAVSSLGMGLLEFVAAVSLSIVIMYAMQTGEITAGGFASFVAASLWLTGPARRLSRVNETIQTGLAAAHSAFALIDEPPEQDDGMIELATVRGHVEFRGVGFRYPQADKAAVENISFTLEAGQTLALVGSSGSGKTTLASLLPRFYRAGTGEILLDGVNINALKLGNLRRHIALVGQETLLFDDSIANNIAYGQDGPIDEARLAEAARAAYVLEFAERLPEGLQTRVGERGMRLSGGQRQRVAIARALYKNAPILILDEATSALDTESERYVQEAMRRLMANRTTLVIAHRLSTVEHANRIIVLTQGRVVESGTHAELLARNGAYANLYRSQFNDAA